MNFEEFFQEARRLDLQIKFDNPDGGGKISLLSNEALFHLPLLATIILALSKGSRKPRFMEIGQLVGECLEKALSGFKGSAQQVGWSANLRIRTVKALSFLEMTGLVAVDESLKTISATERGRQVIERAYSTDSNLSVTLQVVERIYRNICAERQINMELS